MRPALTIGGRFSGMSIAPGTRLHHYTVLRPLGAGGMGEVYLADDASLGRQLALKVLPAHVTQDVERVERFEQEARAASALNHPNIITIHAFGRSDEGLFIAMELVDGETLRQLSRQSWTVEALAAVGRQTAEALRLAHRAGIIHRDIKPENIMLRGDGYVKVLDFGLARLAPGLEGADEATIARTVPGALVGTMRYMSPEQARGDTVTSATDIFSLGLVLYELAARRHPFETESALQVLHAIVTESPLPPSRLNPGIPGALDTLILGMLAKDPRLRPSADEVERSLADVAGARTRSAGIDHRARQVSRVAVGRENEHAELGAAVEAVTGGRGRILSVSGEPGAGKTTLVEDFVNQLSASERACRVARGRCSERLAGTEAYLPWLEALGSLLVDASDGTVARAMKALAPTWYAQVAPRISDESSGARLPVERGAASQEALKRELTVLLKELSTAHPLVFFFDDLHWADASTVDLLAFVADRLEDVRLLVIATYRPSDLQLAKHPFLGLKQSLQARGICHDVALDFLTAADVERFLAVEFADHRFPPDLAAHIHARTEGSPLFMVDLLRYMRDRQVLVREQEHWVLARSLAEVDRELPESVRGMIERKIAQLDDNDRRLMTAASVQGFEFDSAVLASVLALDPADVEERLDTLDRVHAFVRLVEETEFPDRTLTLRYRFVHVLYQNVLYGAVRPTRKAQLAGRFAETLERFWGDKASSIATELAVLFESARVFARAATYFQLAARRAQQLFASQEAVVLAGRALEMVGKMPGGREQLELELATRIILGNALIATRGYGAPDVAETYARARVLCERIGDTPFRLPALWGSCAFSLMRARYDEVLRDGRAFLELVEHQDDPAAVIAHRVVGQALLFTGQPTSARRHFQRIADVYDPARHRALTWLYAQEPGMAGHALLALTLWLLGYPDKALAHSQEALRLGREVPQHHSQANALVWVALHHMFRREWQQVGALAEETVALAAQQGMRFWAAVGSYLHGAAIAEHEQSGEGIEQARRGIAGYHAAGGIILQTLNLSMLSSACAAARRVADGLAALDEADALVQQTGETFWQAEMYRLRGEFLRLNAESGAERLFRQSIDIARQQQAKSLELRAATSLGRLLIDQGRRVEAKAAIGEIYQWFTEGFDSRDLMDAKAVFEATSRPS